LFYEGVKALLSKPEENKKYFCEAKVYSICRSGLPKERRSLTLAESKIRKSTFQFISGDAY
jgi:hypothetical protein